jgi:hypothetical protein
MKLQNANQFVLTYPSFTLHSDRNTSRDYCAAALRIFEESNRTNMLLLRRIQQLEDLQGIDGELLQGKFFLNFRLDVLCLFLLQIYGKGKFNLQYAAFFMQYFSYFQLQLNNFTKTRSGRSSNGSRSTYRSLRMMRTVHPAVLLTASVASAVMSTTST